jgi:hypothetical protein
MGNKSLIKEKSRMEDSGETKMVPVGGAKIKIIIKEEKTNKITMHK